MISSSHSFASALAHLVLTGSSCWALSKINYEIHGKFAWAAFYLNLAHGVAGLFKYGMPQHSNNYKFLQIIRSFYFKIRLLNKNLTLPLLTIQLCTQYDLDLQFLHLFLIVVPVFHVIRYLIAKPFSVPEIEQYSQLFCLATIGYVSYLHNNDYGYAMLFSHVVAMYVHQMSDELSKRDTFVYALSFFIFFSYKTLHYTLPFYIRYFY